VLEAVENLLAHTKAPLIVGNLATYQAAEYFLKHVASDRLSLKVGVGGGSVCTTRVRTGCGMPTFQSVLDVVAATRETKYNVAVIADGGIRTSGDVVKCLAAGADAVMLGSILAGTDEAPGSVVRTKEGLFKQYYGSASHRAKKEFFGSSEYVEGAERLVPYKGSVAKVLSHLLDGVRSGFTYCGASSLSELRSTASFVRVSGSGYLEGLPHGLT
jgi:IMP dehydrogenase